MYSMKTTRPLVSHKHASQMLFSYRWINNVTITLNIQMQVTYLHLGAHEAYSTKNMQLTRKTATLINPSGGKQLRTSNTTII